MDLILAGKDKASLEAAAIRVGLMVEGGEGPVPASGVAWQPWLGSGKLMLKPAITDENGDVVDPAQFAAGYWVIVRTYGAWRQRDTLVPGESDGNEQWFRSRLVKKIKQSGTAVNRGGIPGISADGLEVYRVEDVNVVLEQGGAPGHIFG